MEATPDYKEVQAFHVTAGAKAGGEGNLTNLAGSPHIAVGGIGWPGTHYTSGVNQKQHGRELVVQT